MWKTITTLLISLLVTGLFGQIPTQNIRGKVVDGANGNALIGAYVCLSGTEPLRGAVSDENGIYRLTEVPVGRYQVEVSYLGYETLVVPEALLESGKELILDIRLFEKDESLGEIVVRAADVRRSSQTQISLHTLTVEESFRFPATFNDPARLAHTFAGVTNTNDQANHTSVRGNSPNSLSWRLEGVEIVNPNHLSNAGTFADRPTQSGGGVNILSAQVLGNSNFYTGAFPVEYGNVLGGIMDMRFRNGNDEKHEFTGQAGLIGFDFSAEGPLVKNEGISYLVNYRYSFVGLLAAMGVDFGGESIGYQDLSFNVKAPYGKNGVVKAFGMGGLSQNKLTAVRDPDQWEVEKDRKDIIFKNKMGALGASLSTSIGEKSSFNFTTVRSAYETTTRSDFIFSNLESEQIFPIDTIAVRKLSIASTLLHKLNKRHGLKIGLSGTHHYYDLISLAPFVWANGEMGGWLQESFVQWEWTPRIPVKMQMGLHQSYFTLTKSRAFEPRANLSWFPNSKDIFSAAYGLHSELQSPRDYLTRDIQGGQFVVPNDDLDFSKAHHFVLAYKRKITRHSTLSMELYYQSLFNIPARGSYSVLNSFHNFRTEDLNNIGTGTNYGVELSWQQFMTNDFYYLINASIFNSKYKDSRGIERDTRQSNNFVVNATAGKEFSWQKDKKLRKLGVNLRAVYAGGLKTTPIDEYASAGNGFTIYERDELYSIQQKHYFKVDLRVYYKNIKKKYTSTLSLDLQNVTNYKNEAYQYYDGYANEVLTQYQLGLIPNLAYRIEF